MKTLYITDLDGTFLTNKGTVSEISKQIINRLSCDGLLFSAATARSVLSALPLLDGINVTAPIVAMSGVVVYDTFRHKTVKYYSVGENDFNSLISVFTSHKKAPFAFFFNKKAEEYQIIFTELKLGIHKDYYDIRHKTLGELIHKADSYEIPKDFEPIFVSICDEHDDLVKICDELDKIGGVTYSFYKDTYTPYWFLEVFNSQVSKANGLKAVKQLIGADRTVAFGDNRNDLALFKEADLKCAVENAVDELKEKADIIIGSNEDDSVAKFIENDFIK